MRLQCSVPGSHSRDAILNVFRLTRCEMEDLQTITQEGSDAFELMRGRAATGDAGEPQAEVGRGA